MSKAQATTKTTSDVFKTSKFCDFIDHVRDNPEFRATNDNNSLTLTANRAFQGNGAIKVELTATRNIEGQEDTAQLDINIKGDQEFTIQSSGFNKSYGEQSFKRIVAIDNRIEKWLGELETAVPEIDNVFANVAQKFGANIATKPRQPKKADTEGSRRKPKADMP